jgi:fumarate hydratase subunit beta
MAKSLTIPISDESIRSLHTGDDVLLNGVIVTGRDAAHKWLHDRFITGKIKPDHEDKAIYEKLRPLLNGSLIYHCGPVVNGLDTGEYRFAAAGPTTSSREEPYQGDILRHFNLKGVLGKGGMGKKTLQACRETPAAYFHAVGGAAALIAQRVARVLDVFKLDFGVPEAMWVIEVSDLPAVVTMDAHSRSLHQEVEDKSRRELARLIGTE